MEILLSSVHTLPQCIGMEIENNMKSMIINNKRIGNKVRHITGDN